MAILLNVVGYENAPWVEVLQRELPTFKVLEPHQVEDPAEITYAAIWQHPYNDLQRYPNLKGIMNLGAGADHIDQDPALEHLSGVPVVRLIDPDVGIDMAHYALYWAMHFQRDYELYRHQSQARKWGRTMRPRACDWRITVLGLGRIGRFIAEQVRLTGFVSQAWNRSPQELPGVEVFAGYDQLDNVLANSDVVVNCLPLNQETKGLLDDERFKVMPNSAYLINISRGAVVNEQAITHALQAGQIAGAALDCFEQEPLNESSPLWDMPNVYVTPHMSGATFARSAALVVVENINKMERGEAPSPIHRMT